MCHDNPGECSHGLMRIEGEALHHDPEFPILRTGKAVASTASASACSVAAVPLPLEGLAGAANGRPVALTVWASLRIRIRQGATSLTGEARHQIHHL